MSPMEGASIAFIVAAIGVLAILLILLGKDK